MKKKLIALSLALLMVFSLLPVMAMADAEADLNAAIIANDFVKLSDNVVLKKGIDIGKTVTIDLAGHKITTAETNYKEDYVIAVLHGGNLTVMDSVGGGAIDAGKVMCGIKMTKDNTDIDETKTAVLTVNGGTLIGDYYGIAGNGSAGRGNTVITINGGVVKGTHEEDNLGIYNPQLNSELTVNGGEIVGYCSGIEMRAGVLNVTGGEITATAESFSCNPNGSGTTTTGAAVAIAQHTTKQDIIVNISGGTLTGVKALNESNPQDNDPKPKVKMAISGGNFNGKVTLTDVQKCITGGEFSVAPDSAYLAEGRALLPYAKTKGETFGVVNYQKALGAIFTEATINPPMDFIGVNDASMSMIEKEAANVGLVTKAVMALFDGNYSDAVALAEIFPADAADAAAEKYGRVKIWDSTKTVDTTDADIFVNNLGYAVIEAVKDILAATESKPENTVENFVDVAGASQLKVHFAKCEDAAAEACAEIDAELAALKEAGGLNILASLKAANAKRTIKMIPGLVTIYAIKTDTINELQKLALGENTALASLALGASLIAGIFAIKFDKGAEFTLATQLLGMMSGLMGFLTNLFS